MYALSELHRYVMHGADADVGRSLAFVCFGMGDRQAMSVSFLMLAVARLPHVEDMREPRAGVVRNERAPGPR